MNRSGRLPVPTGEPWEDARRALRWAMGGAGLTVDKLASIPVVLALPVVAAATAAAPPERTLTAAYDAIVAAARQLGDTVHARILRTALAIDYAGTAKDLTSRREEFVREHNDAVRAAGRSDYIAETNRAMFESENRMLGSLLTVLGAAPPSAAAVPEQRDDAADTDRPVPEFGPRGWMYENREVTYRFNRRAGTEVECVYVVSALEDGIDSAELAYFCNREGGSAAEFVMLEGGGVADDRSVGRENFRVVTVRFPALKKGESRRLRFDVRYPPTAESEPWFVINVVRPTRRIIVRLHFDTAEPPVRVWRIDGLLPEAQGGSPDEATALEPDEWGVVEGVFSQPLQGLTYGVGWQFPQSTQKKP